jgi:hypothetical protein
MSPCATTAGRRLIAPWLERSRDHKIGAALPFCTNIVTTPAWHEAPQLARDQPHNDWPSQTSAPVYGYSLTLNGVTKLSTAKCDESPLAEFTPDALNCGRCTPTTGFPGLS